MHWLLARLARQARQPVKSIEFRETYRTGSNTGGGWFHMAPVEAVVVAPSGRIYDSRSR